jgi:hypothetical protein
VDKRGGFLFIFNDQYAYAPTLRKCHRTVKSDGSVNDGSGYFSIPYTRILKLPGTIFPRR